MREEELRRFPRRYIECVNSPDGRVLRSNREIREAFRAHFRDRFARYPGLQVQKFHKWIIMLYPNPVVVQVNGRRSKAFAIERSVRQGCPLSPLLYVLTLEPLLCRLRDERNRLAQRGISLTSSVRAKISAFADDITVFVSRDWT